MSCGLFADGFTLSRASFLSATAIDDTPLAQPAYLVTVEVQCIGEDLIGMLAKNRRC